MSEIPDFAPHFAALRAGDSHLGECGDDHMRKKPRRFPTGALSPQPQKSSGIEVAMHAKAELPVVDVGLREAVCKAIHGGRKGRSATKVRAE